jgi:parallel beta-helix repeat protein
MYIVADETTVSDNTIHLNEINGIYVVGASNNLVIEDNHISENMNGIYLDGVTDILIQRNRIEDGTWGLYLYAYSPGPANRDNTIFENRIINNDYGIEIVNGRDNLIYNNYFSNTNNAIDITGENDWNIDPIAGDNIIDGNYLAGNYWHDDTSVDTDHDGLGDSGVPYNNGITIGGDDYPLKWKIQCMLLDNITQAGIIYFFGKLLPIQLSFLQYALLIGPYVIKVRIIKPPHPIENVEILIDDEPVHTFNQPPFEWKWGRAPFGVHKIQIRVFDSMGNSGTLITKVIKLL